MKRSFTCVICPNGCEIEAEYREGGEIVSIQGEACPKGKEYVTRELTDPRRNIATSVPVEGGELPLVSVRLDRPIPKAMIFPVMEEINTLRVKAPARIGQVLLENAGGTGSCVIATKNVEKRCVPSDQTGSVTLLE